MDCVVRERPLHLLCTPTVAHSAQMSSVLLVDEIIHGTNETKKISNMIFGCSHMTLPTWTSKHHDVRLMTTPSTFPSYISTTSPVQAPASPCHKS